jgi:hypothetical protein
VTLEHPLNDPALHADTFAVDDPHLEDSARAAGVEVLANDIGDIPRLKGVKIEDTIDRELDRLVFASIILRFAHGC